MCEIDDGPHDGGCGAAGGDLADEQSIDLHFAERHLVELRERGGADTEVIERESDAANAQAREDVHHEIRIIERGSFGDFERQLLRGGIEFAQDQSETIRELEILHQSRRQIHGRAEIESTLTPMTDLPDRIGQHEIRHADDESGLFGERQKLTRQQQSQTRMPPAHERFGTAHLPILLCTYDLGLIVDDQLMFLDGPAQVFDRDALGGLDVLEQERLDVFEHGGFLQRPEHAQSELIAKLPCADEHTLIHAAREHDAGIGTDPTQITQRFDAIHAGHLQIEQDQCGIAIRQLLSKGIGAVRSDHVATDAFAHLNDELQKVDFVIDGQYQIAFTPGHVWSPHSCLVSLAPAVPDPRGDKACSTAATCRRAYPDAESSCH